MSFREYASLVSTVRSAPAVLELEVKRLYLKQHVKQLYGNADPSNLWASLLRHRWKPTADTAATPGGQSSDEGGSEELRIAYDGYRAVVYELTFGSSEDPDDGHRAWRKSVYFQHPFLSPSVFLEFARCGDGLDGVDGTISAVPLYAFVAKRMLLFRLRVELELCGSVAPVLRSRAPMHVDTPRCAPSPTAPESNGLTVDDLEAFIADLVPHLRVVRDMPPWMLPYYLCHASRKFFFLCDPRSCGALSVDKLMKSDVFSELLRLFESDAQDATVSYPVGAVVEIPKRHVLQRGDDASTPLPDGIDEEEELVLATVVEYENEGNLLSDMYTVVVAAEEDAAAKECRSPIEEEGSPPPCEPVTVRVPRGSMYWCAQTSEHLSAELIAQDNWFSLPLMHRVYLHFTQLDADGDGVLSEREMLGYSNGSYTPLAVHRLFECYVSSGDGDVPAMDYKGYLNFVVATEHPHTLAAKRYLWRMLDLEDTHSYISLSALRCFTRDVSEMLIRSGLMSPTNHITSASILSEVVDMINPRWHEHVTADDLDRCKQQATVLLILLNFRSFYAYDCREQSAAASTEEFVSG